MAAETVENERGSTGTKANQVHDSVNCKEAACVFILIQYSRLKQFQKKYIEKMERNIQKKRRNEQGRKQIREEKGEKNSKDT